MKLFYPAVFGSFVWIAILRGWGDESSDSKHSRYTVGCLDSVKVRQLYSRGHLDEVISEIESFKRYIRISPKPCEVFSCMYYGVSEFALGDSASGEIAWRALLKLDPQREIWDFQLPLFLQSKFDGIKRDLWQSGSVPYPYGKDYIPATYPDPKDGAALQKLRALYHNARLNAYLGSYETSKKDIKEYLLLCEKKKEAPDPAILILKGELMSRYAPTDRSMLMQSILLIESGMEADKQSHSRIVSSADLQSWGERITQRFLIQAKDVAAGK